MTYRGQRDRWTKVRRPRTSSWRSGNSSYGGSWARTKFWSSSWRSSTTKRRELHPEWVCHHSAPRTSKSTRIVDKMLRIMDMQSRQIAGLCRKNAPKPDRHQRTHDEGDRGSNTRGSNHATNTLQGVHQAAGGCATGSHQRWLLEEDDLP